METAACAICASPLRAEIEKKDIPGKSAEAIAWARKQGLNISKFSLAKHRANHISGNTIESDTERQSLTRTRGTSAGRKIREEKSILADIPKAVIAEPKGKTEIQHMPLSDLEFLDTVRDMVYKKLVSGEMELKLESGFKAIEIKNKISEESQSEKLLLEILNEIRAEELSK